MSYLYVYPSDTDIATQQTINLWAYETKVMLQPFTQLRGAPIAGQVDSFHTVILNIAGGALCLPFWIDVIIHDGDQLNYQAGEIDLHAPMSCLLFHNGATFKIADGATLDYGADSHQGVLALYEDAKLIVGDGSTLNINNTVHIREQNPLNGPKQFYMTLNTGSTLRFLPGSRLINDHSADGTIKLNVYMKGGILDDRGLPESDTHLINRIYDPPVIGRFNIGPIPVRDLLHVDIDASRFSKLVLTDILGRNMGEFSIASSTFDIATSNLPNGIYMLNATGAKGTQTVKWVKQ